MKAIVVGAGIGGISTAILLKKVFDEVTVLEKNSTPGGRARYFSAGEFRFDMGPSWYLMPEIFEEFFSRIGQENYPIVKVKPPVKVIEGKSLEKAYGEFTGDNVDERYLDKVKRFYDFSKKFVKKEMSYLDFLDREVLTNFSALFNTLDYFNSLYFKDSLLKKAMGFSSVFIGGSPFKVPAIYAMINYAIYGQGVFYPHKGFEGYVKRLCEIATKMGVEFKFNFSVNKVKIDNNKVVEVSSDDKKESGDVFVFNMDYFYADSLLPEEYKVIRGKRYKLSPSAILAYIGLENTLDLPHHTVIINGNWREHFESIERNSLPSIEDTSYYVSYRGATDKEARDLIILIPVGTGTSISKELVNAVIKDLEVKIGSKIKASYFRIYGPEDFKRDYNAFEGTAFGLAHTLDQTGPFRLSMKNPRLKNLYYVGQYTQPGIGVPMVTLSAMILSKKILKELS
ncbi:phytoene desaturase family protein [Saccharolobus islandicus]|uniref:Phytoene desaturase n=2 Tax=Saccharolobus islandicus TaxID=43080 RepID=C4KDV5_SACI6|nr:NAD(P)/FAD-dependent oxidoreductase [Sulfolobus islandicus]ACP54438.1 phytoene desaturase [Sulfolobus islandicus M.16.27]ACR41078.1 phytoene desaturase [Sulfolobus islandicus M.16.4]